MLCKLNLWSKIRFSALEDELAREAANTFNFSTCNISVMLVYQPMIFHQNVHIYIYAEFIQNGYQVIILSKVIKQKVTWKFNTIAVQHWWLVIWTMQ